MPVQDTIDVDLLVVGSGAAGLTAAVVARHEGLDVLVVEKAEVYGGTTALSGGVAWVPNNSLMLSAGIPDTPDDALTYLKHNIGNRVAESKLQAFVENAPKMADYLMRRKAIAFQIVDGFPDYRPETPGGHKGGRSIDPKVFPGRKLKDFDRLRRASRLPGGFVGSVTELRRLAFAKSNPMGLLKSFKMFPRNLWNRLAGRKHIASGGALVAHLRYTLDQLNVPLWLNTPLEELLVANGAVVGARVTRNGTSVTVRARRGVVMAAGGFEHNPAMRRQFFGDKAPDGWVKGTYTAGSPANTGDGIRAGQSIGAALDIMDDMWWMPVSNPPGGGTTIHVFERGLPHVMIVNKRGERFANEARPYNEIGRVMYEDDAPPAFLIFDNTYRSTYALGTMLPGMTPQKYIDAGYLHRADTLEALAAQTGIDHAGLQRTVGRFNQMAAAGKDEDFHKGESAFDLYAGDPAHKPNPCLGPVETAPFYALQIHAGDLGTKGGLLTNEKAQVLREDGTVVKGLYAAGNSSACVMGNFYPGAGGTIGAGMTYGYLAALDAASR